MQSCCADHATAAGSHCPAWVPDVGRQPAECSYQLGEQCPNLHSLPFNPEDLLQPADCGVSCNVLPAVMLTKMLPASKSTANGTAVKLDFLTAPEHAATDRKQYVFTSS